jgi:CTP synthase (UTP-ammonia lyase)
MSTSVLAPETRAARAALDAVVVAPQCPEYCGNEIALRRTVRSVREADVPCLAVCGGARYALWAAAEAGAPALRPVSVSAYRCTIGGGDFRGRRTVRLRTGTRAARAYGLARVEETFSCTRRIEPAALPALRAAGIVDCGHTPGMGATLFECTQARFHLAALFLPHWSGRGAHPLFVALLREAIRRPPDRE